MQQWQDGVSLGDVPLPALLAAVGELALRLDEERGRWGAAHAFGIIEVGGAVGVRYESVIRIAMAKHCLRPCLGCVICMIA